MDTLLFIIFISVAAVSLFIMGARVRERGEQIRRAEKALEAARQKLASHKRKSGRQRNASLAGPRLSRITPA